MVVSGVHRPETSMADFQLKDFDDQLAEHVRAYVRQRRCNETQWFESAAQNELNNIGSQAPYRDRQVAGRDAIHNHKYVRHGDVSIGDISVLSGWNFIVGKLIELPENFIRVGWGWFLGGVAATFGYIYVLQLF